MNILTGMPKDERGAGQGGINQVFIALKKDISNFSIDETTGAVTFESAADAFKEYEMHSKSENGGSYIETVTTSQQAYTTSTECTLTMIFPRQSKEKRREIKVLARQEVVAVIKENSGEIYFAGGFNGLMLSTGTNTSGTTYNESSSNTVVLRGLEPEGAPSLDATVFAQIVAGSAITAL